MQSTSKFLISTGILTLAAAAVADGGGPWQPPPGYHPLPPELQGDLPPDHVPQGDDDLRRTRNALYGKELTTSQHEEIVSWRTHDLGWWMDDSRRAAARAKLESLDDIFEALAAEEDFGDSVGSSEDHFGLEVELHYQSSGEDWRGDTLPPTFVQATVTYDARKRPDLFDFYELIHDFAASVAGSPQGEGTFLQVIDPAEETLDGVAAYQATRTHIEALKAEIGALTRSSLKTFLKRFVDWGWPYTVEAADTFQDDLRTAIDQLTELRTMDYLAALPDDYRKRLSSHVIRKARAGRSVTRGYYSRGFKEDRAAEFEALLADWRGGKS